MKEKGVERTDLTSRQLLEILRLGDAKYCPPEEMASILSSNFDRFLKVISWYDKPNASAKSTLLSGKLVWRNNLPLDSKQQEFVLKISSTLQLDEVQSFRLLESYLRVELLDKLEYSDSTLQEIFDFYLDDRLCLFHCISSLFRNAEDTSHVYWREANSIVDRLIGSKFAENMVNIYQELCKAELPKDMGLPFNTKWANHCVYEQYASLEIVFLIYYTRLTCPWDVLAKLVSLFQSQGFGMKQSYFTLLNDSGRTTVARIGYLSVLIVIECLNLETWLDDSDGREIDRDIVTKIDKEFSNWGALVQQGPILLAWAALIMRMQHIAEQLELDAKHHVYKALQLQAFAYLSTMLKEGFESDEPNLTGYKSVLKGLMSILLTAFQVVHLPDYLAIVDLYCEIMRHESGICRQFWEHDFRNDALRSLFEVAQARFPLQFVPFVKMMTALAGDAECSRTIFIYLHEHMNTFAQSLDQWKKPSKYQVLQDDERHVVIQTGEECFVEGLVIPPKTLGLVVDSMVQLNSSISFPLSPASYLPQGFVQWQVQYSAWSLFLAYIDNFLKRIRDASVEELEIITSILILVRELTKFQPLLLDQQHQCVFPMDYTQPVWLSHMFMILEHASFLPSPPLDLLAACIDCIHSFASVQPDIVWQLLKRTSPLEGSWNRGNYSGSIRHLLTSAEILQGQYPVTLAFLDLLCTLVESLPLHLAGVQEEFEVFLGYLRSDLFARYDSWKYTRPLQRWQIGIKILSIFQRVMSANERPFLEAVLQDSSFHHPLLTILGIGHKSIIALFDLRKMKEAHTLETLVLQGLMLLEEVLSRRESDHRANFALLDYAITNVGSRGLIATIATYIYYPYNSRIPLLATKILTSLCSLTVALNSHGSSRSSPSLVGYLTHEASRLQISFLNKLKDVRESEEMRIAIIRLITKSLDTQPGLAELFFNLLLLTSGKKDSNQSCVYVVLDMVARPEFYMKNHERLYSEALGLLVSLWYASRDYHTIVEVIRKTPDFWTNLTKPLHESASSSDQTVIQARIFQIVALEMYSGDKGDNLALLKKSHLKYLRRFIHCKYDLSLQRTLERQVKEVDLTWADILEPQQPTVDLVKLERNYSFTKSKAYEALLTTASIFNKMVTLADAQLALLRAWKCFFQVSLLRQSDIPDIIPMVEEITTFLKDEKRENRVVLAVLDELVDLLVLLIGHATKRGEKMQGNLLQQLVNAVAEYQVRNAGIVISLLTSILQLLSMSGSNDQPLVQLVPYLSLSNRAELPITLAILNRIVSNVPNPHLTILHLFHQSNMFGQLLHIVGTSIQQGEVSLTEMVLHTLIAIAHNSFMAVALMDQGLIYVLCSEMVISLSKEPSWDRSWYLVLTLVSTLLQTIGSENKQLVDQAFEFVNLHQGRIFGALESNNTESLEEVHCVLRCLNLLVHCSPQWKWRSSGLGALIQSSLASLVQHYVLLLQSGKAESSLMSLYGVLSSALVITNYVLGVPKLLKAIQSPHSAEIKFWNPAYTPSLEISADGPGLGVLIGILNCAFGELRKGPNPKTATTLVRIIENTLAILLAHIAFYLLTTKKEDPTFRRVKEDLGTELENFLSRLNRELQRIYSRTPQMLELLYMFEAYLEQLLAN